MPHISAKARIGIMVQGLAAYWPQFAGMRENLLGHYQTLLEKFDGGVTLVDAGLVDSIDAARSANQLFRANDVDVVFVHLVTYANSEPLIIALDGVSVPVVMLNVQSVPALDVPNVKEIADWLGTAVSCAGLPEATAVLLRTGKRFDVITGYLTGDALVDRSLGEWCRAAAVRAQLRTKSFGLLGRPYPGMTDLYIDEVALFSRFGAYVQHLNWDDVARHLAAVTDVERDERMTSLLDAFEVPDDVDPDAVSDAAGVLAAFDRLIAEYNLCALPNHYEGPVGPNHVGLLANSNPAFSILMREGIACPVEADIKTAMAMLALKAIAGTATLAELYSMDFRDDVVILGHSGAADVTISDRRPVLRHSAVFHGKSGSGFLTQAYPRQGPMTLLSMAQSRDGDFYLVAAEGEIVAGAPMELGDTNCRVRFSPGLRDFVNGWSMQGPTHHGVMAGGHHIDALECVAKVLGLPLNVVCR